MQNNILIYVLVIVVLGLIGFAAYQSFGPNLKGVIPQDKIGEYTLNFIKNELASPDTEFTLGTTTEENGMYKVDFEVMGQKESAYVTKNGKYLFFQPIDMMPPEPQALPKADKPKLELFVMSYCPYGNQAEELLMPVIDLLGDKIDAQLHYIIYDNYATGYPDYCLDKDMTYCSMHGVAEVEQDIRELCVQKYQPEKLWSFVIEINNQTTPENVEQKWENIANSIGIDAAQIKTCEQNEAVALLQNEVNLTNKPYPVQDPQSHQGQEEERINGSPTMVINGMIYDGSRGSNDYKDAICSAFNNPPAECDQDLAEDNTASSGSCK